MTTTSKPDYTNIPARHARAPVPCDTKLLTLWLNLHHGYSIPEGTKLTGGNGSVLFHVQRRFGAVPTENASGTPWPSEVWQFVRDEAARIAGGQQSLFAADAVLPHVALASAAIGGYGIATGLDAEWPRPLPTLLTEGRDGK